MVNTGLLNNSTIIPPIIISDKPVISNYAWLTSTSIAKYHELQSFEEAKNKL